MRKVLCAIALAIPVAAFAQAPADSVSPRARQLHDRAIVVDSHDDTTQRLIIEHIDHAVKIAGVDHVGLGSDFDGATMPLGMEDASKLPKITDALLKKGYSEADVEKILGGNILRVMEAVERLKGA